MTKVLTKTTSPDLRRDGRGARAKTASPQGIQERATRSTSPQGGRSSVAARRDSALERSALALQALKRQAPPEVLESFASHLEQAVRPVKARAQSQAERDRAAFIAELSERQSWTPPQVAALEAEALANYFARRRELLAGALTASQVADLLGSSRQTPHDRLKSGSLLAVLDNGALRFPVWQFDAAGPDGVIAGLPEVVRSLALPAFSKIGWMVRPQTTLDGRSPLQALQEGELARVLQAARAAGVS